MDPIRVLIADDHTLVRAGIRVLLLGLEGVEVVAEAGDGREALGARGGPPAGHPPDRHRHAAHEWAGAGRARGAELASTRVIILSMHATEEYANRALEAGAAGYLLKNSGAAELEIAVRAVARDETYLSPAVSKHVIANYLSRMGGAPSGVRRRRRRASARSCNWWPRA